MTSKARSCASTLWEHCLELGQRQLVRNATVAAATEGNDFGTPMNHGRINYARTSLFRNFRENVATVTAEIRPFDDGMNLRRLECCHNNHAKSRKATKAILSKGQRSNKIHQKRMCLGRRPRASRRDTLRENEHFVRLRRTPPVGETHVHGRCEC